MKEKIKLALIILICIIAPIIIGWGVSQDILNEWTNDNDWIGFWGSYVGAILGGLVSLYVMRYTINKTERIAELERKKEFCDNLLKELIDYHIGIKHFAQKLARSEEFDMDKAIEVSKNSEILTIKVNAKKNDKNYIYCESLKNDLEELTKSFNQLLNFRIEKGFKISCDTLYNECVTKSDIFFNTVEEFYEKNNI